MDIDISLDYGLTLLAALLIGTGFVLQQNAAQRESDSRFLSLRLIIDLFHQPRWLLGIGAMIAGQILAAWSIGNLPLAFVEPLLATNLVFALILAVPIAKATLRFWEITGALVLCSGVALLSASRSAKPIGLSFGSFSHWPAAAVIAVIAFACVQAGRRRPGRARAMLTGVGAGLVFGIQDALTRQTLQALHTSGLGGMLSTWAPYALVGAGATGIWLMQSAFSAGPLNVSLPAISAGEPVVGILLGVVVFGDRIQDTPGELAIYAGGLAALVVGVIMVGRSPALSHLRAWTEESISSLPTLPALPALPHVPVPHVPALPRGRAGRRGEHGEHGDEERPESDDDPDGGLPAETAAADAEREEPPPPVSGGIVTIRPPETGGAAHPVQPDMRGLFPRCHYCEVSGAGGTWGGPMRPSRGGRRRGCRCRRSARGRRRCRPRRSAAS
ncbi:MAG: DMT family transporter [Trebonia sp.]